MFDIKKQRINTKFNKEKEKESNGKCALTDIGKSRKKKNTKIEIGRKANKKDKHTQRSRHHQRKRRSEVS